MNTSDWVDEVLASFYSDGDELKGGGVFDHLRLFSSTVRLSSASNVVLGSGVVVADRWVLTAAHIFCGHPDIVYCESPDGTRLAKAEEIHWITGAEPHLFPSHSADWPEKTEDMSGRGDRLALVRFDRRLPSRAKLVDASGLEARSRVVVAGFGMKENGGYGTAARFVLMDHYGECGTNRRASIRADVLGGGAPRKDDSGAPVFEPRFPRLQRVVGVHCATHAPEDCPDIQVGDGVKQLSLFIPIDADAITWIGKLAHLPDTSTQAEHDSAFCLRERFTCALAGAERDYVGRYRIAIVSSATKALPKWGVLEITSARGLHVSIRSCGGDEVASFERVSLQNLSGRNDGTYHCLLAESEVRDVFIFLRPPLGVNEQGKRRVRLEVFRNPSTHDRPSESMIGERFPFPDDPVLPIFKGCPTGVQFVGRDDQDDEGEGYED